MTDKNKTKMILGLSEILIWIWLIKYDWKIAIALIALQALQAYAGSQNLYARNNISRG